MKIVSIVTICYNEEETISRTIESVSIQTARNDFEFLVFDGASTDATRTILERFRPSIDVLVSERDQGRYDAMNKGIRAAKGEYILFMNGGDRFYSETTVEHVLKAGLDADIVYGDGLVDRYGTLHPLPHADGVLKHEMFFMNTSLCHQAEMIRRDLFCRAGLYDLSYSLISDHVFNYRAITKYRATTKYVPIVIARIDETGATMTDQPLLEAELKRFAESLPFKQRAMISFSQARQSIFKSLSRAGGYFRRVAKFIVRRVKVQRRKV